MNARQQRAKQMMEIPGFARQIGHGLFEVRSQFTPEKYYLVSTTDKGLVCECLDHMERKSDCKHIEIVLEKIKKKRCYSNQPFRIMDRSNFKTCKFCSSGNIVKAGLRKNKNYSLQRFKCQDCKKRFTANYGFESMRYDDVIITRALQMYYSKMSVRRIADCLEQEDIDVSYRGIYGWVEKYSKMTSKYLNGITPRVGNWFRADEVWIKINGEQNYLFASMDDDTRYWLASDIAETKFQHNADNLLRMTKLQAGKIPRNFITDGLPAYMKSSKKVFGKKTNHVRHIHLKGDMNNNKMERLNGEIRDREKVFRGLKKMDTPILDGMRVYYNFTKKHGSLNDKTPAEIALINVDGKNKWRTIIQNAALDRVSE